MICASIHNYNSVSAYNKKINYYPGYQQVALAIKHPIEFKPSDIKAYIVITTIIVAVSTCHSIVASIFYPTIKIIKNHKLIHSNSYSPQLN
jgi:hypothetical protein